MVWLENKTIEMEQKEYISFSIEFGRSKRWLKKDYVQMELQLFFN